WASPHRARRDRPPAPGRHAQRPGPHGVSQGRAALARGAGARRPRPRGAIADGAERFARPRAGPARSRREPEAGPDQPLLPPGDELEWVVPRAAERQRRQPAAPFASDELQRHLVAEARAHHPAQVADAVDEALLERAPTGEDVAVEELVLAAAELCAAARAHQLLEAVVHVPLHARQALDAARILGEEGVEQRLALAGGIEPALHAEPLQDVAEAEGGADDADRAEHRGLLGVELIGGQRQPVAAR